MIVGVREGVCVLVGGSVDVRDGVRVTVFVDEGMEVAVTVEVGRGVRVNAIGPGVVETPLTGPIKANPDWYSAYAKKNPMNRWAQAREMAGPTVFLLSDAASYVTGTILFADGGWLAADGRFTPPGMAETR